MSVRKSGWVMILVLLAFAAPAFAQDVGSQGTDVVVVEPISTAEAPQPTFGLASEIVHTVPALAFMPPSNTTGFTINASGATGIGVVETTAAGDWWAPVHLPSGALVLRVELEGCDTNAGASLLFGMTRGVSPGGSASNITPVGNSGATPGCAFFPVNLTTPVTVNNRNNNLWLFLNYGALDATNKANAIRVFYRLQVSPSPATATFSDVPTSHPFFQYVEALAAAGITGGCGPAVYCPDTAITRGQMAVFLARALGLHFGF